MEIGKNRVNGKKDLNPLFSSSVGLSVAVRVPQ